MTKMRAVRVTRPSGSLEIVEREIPPPAAGSVRVKVEACGICHSDSLAKEGEWPGIEYPRVPGHEIPGVIDAIGAGVAGWTNGQRVGVGWRGGHCGYCDSCRRGDFVTCQVARQVPGIAYHGNISPRARSGDLRKSDERRSTISCRSHDRVRHVRENGRGKYWSRNNRRLGNLCKPRKLSKYSKESRCYE